MIKSDWSGLNKLQKKLKRLEGTRSVPFDKLFHTGFMNRYTQFSNIEEFFVRGGFIIETEKEFDNIPEEKLDQHVLATTNFGSWREMQKKAGEAWISKELDI